MEERIYYLLTRTETAMSNYIRQQFAGAGLGVTPAQLGILFLLKGKDGRTMTELGRELGTDNSAVTRAVDRMEKSGLVERRNNSNDRREYCITITETGIRETARARKIIDSINAKISAGFSQPELDALRKGLVKMYGLFKADKDSI